MIIKKKPNPSGAYPAPQTWNAETPPNGYAVISDAVDMADFYAYSGFVTLTIEDDLVTSYAPNAEAFEMWKASLPAPAEAQPTWQDQIEAQVVYTAMMTDTLLGG